MPSKYRRKKPKNLCENIQSQKIILIERVQKNMNYYTRTQLTHFMGILKTLNLTKEEIFGICILMKKEEMITEIINRIKVKGPETTHQEALQICTAVIKENL